MREMIISRSVISPALILVEILITLSSAEVKAVPSFACQTGMPWSACHVQAFGDDHFSHQAAPALNTRVDYKTKA